MREQPRKHKSMRRTPWDESKELTPVQRFIRANGEKRFIETPGKEWYNEFEVKKDAKQ